MSRDLVIGIHSIAEIIKTNSRKIIEIVGTDDGLIELKKRGDLNSIPKELIRLASPHKLQEDAKRIYEELDYTYQRVPSQVYAVVEEIDHHDLTELYSLISGGKVKKIIALDQVTDVHNAAAIMRTAAFYGVDAVLVSMKGSFGRGPNFARIASGALEHVRIYTCSSLPKALTKLKNQGIECIGFSEHSDTEFSELVDSEVTCLVLGAEDLGMSNAVERVIDKRVALVSQGPIKSLNVSVAAAVAMEKIFSKKACN